jgi:hypothetical protein
MDSRPSASWTLAGAIFLVVFGAGLISGANLPDRLAREVPKPVPGFWKWLDRTLPRRAPTLEELHPSPPPAIVEIAVVDLVSAYRNGGMSEAMVLVENCYADWAALRPVLTRNVLLRCAMMDRLAVAYDRSFRRNFRLPDGSIPAPISPALAPDRVFARERLNARMLFGGDLRHQQFALELALKPVLETFLARDRPDRKPPAKAPPARASSGRPA